MSLLEQLQVRIFAEIVFGVRCTLRSEIDNINKITLEVRESAIVGFI